MEERIRDVGELARTAVEHTGAEQLSLAATAHNKAALIASDCGLPDLARSLCLRQFDVYMRARPLNAQAARYALEPLVNLARLLIRDDDPQGAYRLLDTLYHAIRHRTDTTIDDRPISFHDLTRSEENHHTLCRWLWTVLLADGTRALAGAGHWDQALAHAAQYGGIGQRLLDGRQIAILAHHLAGDPATALTLIEESTPAEPWEQSVAACLTVLCRRPHSRPGDSAITDMVEHYLALEPTPELVVFRTRLGLTVIDLAGEHPHAARATIRLVNETVTTGDGYAARDVLAHEKYTARLTDAEKRTLSAAVRSSGLGAGTVPAHLMTDLLETVKTSETTTTRNLAVELPTAIVDDAK